MNDLGLGKISTAVTGVAKPEAEIGIFMIKAILIVEKADLHDRRHANEGAGQLAEIGFQTLSCKVIQRSLMRECDIVEMPRYTIGDRLIAKGFVNDDLRGRDNPETWITLHLRQHLVQDRSAKDNVVVRHTDIFGAALVCEISANVAGLRVGVWPSELHELHVMRGADRSGIVDTP